MVSKHTFSYGKTKRLAVPREFVVEDQHDARDVETSCSVHFARQSEGVLRGVDCDGDGRYHGWFLPPTPAEAVQDDLVVGLPAEFAIRPLAAPCVAPVAPSNLHSCEAFPEFLRRMRPFAAARRARRSSAERAARDPYRGCVFWVAATQATRDLIALAEQDKR